MPSVRGSARPPARLGEATLDAWNRAERYRHRAEERRRISAIGSSTKIRDSYVRLTKRHEQDGLILVPALRPHCGGDLLKSPFSLKYLPKNSYALWEHSWLCRVI